MLSSDRLCLTPLIWNCRSSRFLPSVEMTNIRVSLDLAHDCQLPAEW
jgi:hypothetical protein